MENLLIQNISISTIELAMLIMILSFLLILIAFFSNQKGIKSKLDKIEQNLSKINTLINEMNSGYGIIDKNLSSSKEDLTNINETIRSIQKDIGKKSDENLSEQNINKAVDLAKLGVDIKTVPGFLTLRRVTLLEQDGEITAVTKHHQGSGNIASIALGEALTLLDENHSGKKGEFCYVLIL